MINLSRNTAILLVALASPAAAVTDTWTGFLAFGDSLTDPGNLNRLSNGNFATSPPYFEGRFSNGPVWADYVAQEFIDEGLPALNIAFGGARALTNDDFIPDFDAQVATYRDLFAGAVGDRPLVSVNYGPNDLFALVGDDDYLSQADSAVESLIEGLRALGDLGLTELTVWDVPNVGATPRVAVQGAEAQARAKEAADRMNISLLDGIATLETEGYDITVVPYAELSAATIANPQAFGFEEVQLPCLFPDAATAAAYGQPVQCDAATAATRLFWDDNHPNAQAHRILADTFIATVDGAVTPVPVPAPAVLLLAGLAGLGLMRRRPSSGR